MAVFFIAQDDTQTRVLDVAWFAPPSAVINNSQHSNVAEPTENPVEQGAPIADHIRPGNAQYSLEATVTMTPHAADLFYGAGRIMPLPMNLPRPYDPLRRGPPPGTPGSGARAIAAAIQGRLTPPAIAPVTLQFPIEYDPVLTTFNKLDQFRESGNILKILTPERDYDDMIIASLDMVPHGKSASFNLTCRQIRTVSLQLVSAPIPLEPKGEPKLKQGNQPPTDVTDASATERKRSLLRASADKILGGFGFTLPGL